MHLSDIQYLIELLESSIYSQDWDNIQEAINILKEVEKESLENNDTD
jgi:hypothetical protein